VAPPTSDSSDAALVVAVGRFDERALQELHRRHAPAVFGLARRVLGDRAAAEDVMQEVFVQLWRDPGRFDPERGSLRSFLLRIAHNRAVDRVRADTARGRREDRHERERPEEVGDVEREAWELIRTEQVKAAIAELSPGEREAILLAYYDGLSYREVARVLDLPEGTVKSRIRLGMGKLADKLEARGLGIRP
jgi:RNA polymerase sigma-70 factor (ECF subfamily)